MTTTTATTIAVDNSFNLCTDKWWNIITQRYTERHRAYHTLNHLNELFVWFDRFEEKLEPKEKRIVQWSIFFHDIIYDPKARDNEEQSATQFTQFAKEFQLIPSDECQQVAYYIQCTKNHTEHNIQSISFSLKLFLDFDLSILGSAQERYVEYSQQIRYEYSHVPLDAFCEGRGKYLSNWLQSLKQQQQQNRPTSDNNNNNNRRLNRLFYTDEMTLLCQERALSNLEMEAKALEQKELLSQ